MEVFKKSIAALFALTFILGCNQQQAEKPSDSLSTANKVFAATETQPVNSVAGEDAADDPAIWVNPQNPDSSLVVGTDKKSGLHVYNLKGEDLFFHATGLVNNVDIRTGFYLSKGEYITLVAASNRSHNSISVLRLEPKDSAMLQIAGPEIISGVDEVYGFCLYHSKKTGKYYAFVNGKSGVIEQYHLHSMDNQVYADLVRTLKVDSQPEGMVADDELGFLYVGEEEKSIWKFHAEPDAETTKTALADGDLTNPSLEEDIEGLSIYYATDGKGYLIASSQGNNSYAIFERQGSNKYLGSFVVADSLLDGTEETDGLDVINANLGGAFSTGMFIAQDGFNFKGDTLVAQNFKFVPWGDIANSFEPTLVVDTGYVIVY